MTEQEAFIARLRRTRERYRLPLEDIARDTRVKMELLEAFERNDLSAWPRGLYARAYVRAYASAIGLDGSEMVDEFCRLFPQGDRRVESTMKEMAAIVAHPSEWRDEFHHPHDRRRMLDAEMPAPEPTRTESLRNAVVRAGRAMVSMLSGARNARATTRSATR